MAKKCPWDGGDSLLLGVNTLAKNIDENRGDKSDEQIIQEFKEGIMKTIKSKFIIDMNELPEIAPDIVDQLADILDDDTNLVSEDEIMAWFQTDNKIAAQLNTLKSTEEVRGVKSEETQLKEAAQRNFMQDAFGYSAKGKQLFTNFANSVAVNSFIFTDSSHTNICKNSEDFDYAVRQRQNDLFQTIVNYIRSIYSENGIVTDSTINKLATRFGLSEENPDYEFLYKILKGVNLQGNRVPTRLTPNIYYKTYTYFRNLFEKPSNLESLIQLIVDPNINNVEDTKKAQTRIDAYNSWILLNNFDSYIKQVFGSVININQDIVQFKANRYSLSSKGTKLYSTWRDTTDIFLDKEINNISQFIIKTLPKYNYNGDRIPNEYLSFSDFNHLITAKLKALMTKQPTDKDFSNFKYIQFKLLKSTKQSDLEVYQHIKDLTSFQQLVSLIRLNPESYTRDIFYILGNSELYTLLGLEDGTFSPTDKDTIQTINRGLYNGKGSLLEAINRDGHNTINYLAYITQTIDSEFSADLAQYYENSRSEQITSQSLQDSTITKKQNQLIRSISAYNTYSRINYPELKKQFNVEINTTTSGALSSINFTLDLGNNNKLIIYYNPNGELIYNYNNTSYSGEKGKELIAKLNVDEKHVLAQFIHFITDKNVESKQFQEAYTNISGKQFFDDITCYYDMFKLASNILTNIGVSNELMLDKNGTHIINKSDLKTKIHDVFSNYLDYAPGINNDLYEIELISKDSIPMIKTLAKMEAYLDHLLTASQVKDGAGHGASVQNLSRLLSSYPFQQQMQNLKPNSASNHFSMFDKNLFLGIEQMKEAKTLKDYKSHVDFTPVEFEQATLIYDYFNALNDPNNPNTTNPQILRFIPAIMSDKSYIGRIKIDYDAPTKYTIVQSYTTTPITQQDEQKIIDRLLEDLSKLTHKDLQEIKEQYAYSTIGIDDDFGAVELLGRDYFPGYDINQKLAKILPEFGYIYEVNKTLKNVQEGGMSLNQIVKELGDIGIKQIISEELGYFYQKSYNAVQKDWNKVARVFTDEAICKEALGVTATEIANMLLNKPELITNGFFWDNFTFDNYNKQMAYLQQAGFIKYSPVQAVEEITKIWNWYHPNDNIKLTHNVHYENNKQANKLFGTEILSENRTATYLRETFNDPEKTKQYFKEGEKEFLCSLLKDGFEIDLLDNTSLNSLIKNLNPEWVSKATGKLILGQFTYNGLTYNLTSDTEANRLATKIMFDLSKGKPYNYINFTQFLYDLEALNQSYDIVLNPRFRQFNSLQYLFSQEFVVSNVGSHIAHPSKFQFSDYNNPSLQELAWQENTRFNAQFKRNVSYTATVQEFQLNQIDGIPSQYNVAIIDDIKDVVYNILGDAGGKTGTVSPHDGATFVNPFLIDLENNSLGGARAGIIKKPFIHFYDEATGTGGIIKTAGFGITCALMKDSKGYRTIAQNMTDRFWYDEQGQPLTDWNILKGFDTKNPGQLINLQYSNTRETSIRGVESQKVSYAYFDGTNIRRVVGLTYNGNNSYTMDYYTVDDNNNPTSGKKQEHFENVNTNWKLFNMFGGMNSVEFNGERFIQSEYSREAVVKAINKTGTFKNYNDPVHPNLHKTQIKTQEDVYQPLKHSDIHYMPTAGAVKQGMGNINDIKYINKVGKLNYFKINVYQAGIQLDKEHLADNEEISLMTQVVSACVSRGYSFDKSSDMYLALASLAENAIKDSVDLYEKILKNTADAIQDKQKFKQLIIEQIIDSIIHQDSKNSLIESIKQKLIEIEQSNINISDENLDKLIPFSDGSIFNSLASQLSVDITKSAIKLKIDGVLSVLCPAYGFIKIHGGKKLSQYANEQELVNAQKNEPILTQPSQLRIGGCYYMTTKNGDILNITIKRPGLNTYDNKGDVKEYGYLSIKHLLESGEIVSFKNNIIEGRELAHYNAIFEGTPDKSDVRNTYQLYDLASVQRAHRMKETLNLEIPENLERYKLVMRQVQSDISKLTRGFGKVEIMDFEDVGSMEEGVHTVTLYAPAKVESAEVILPRVFQTAYGLEFDDELSDINEQKGLFFTKKILKRLASKIDMKYFDVELKYNNGNHIYIANTDKLPKDYTEDFFKKKINTYEFTIDGSVDENGNPLKELWRIDDNGNKMYRMYSPEDQVYIATTFDGKPQEVIVTSNPNFYIASQKGYSNITLSTTDEDTINRHKSYLETAINSDKSGNLSKLLSRYIKIFDDQGIDRVTKIGKEFYETYNRALYTGNLESFTYSKDIKGKGGQVIFTKNLEAKDYALGRYLLRQGDQMYSSLQKSLDVIAARIPAQSMQSFMSMKIVAFDSSSNNTAYVSSTQLWLQGSDFDIDTTNFTQYSINKSGKIEHWSPLANYNSPELLKASDSLPFPTGKECIDGEIPEHQEDIQSLLSVDEDTGSVYIDLNTPEKIEKMGNIIRLVNKYGLNALDLDTEEYELFKKAINKHNTNIYRKGRKGLDDSTKTYMLTQMFQIIEAPENQIEAQKPIDVATKIVQDVANNPNNPVVKEQKSAGPRNALTVNQGIVNNQVGKKGVGIVAVGLKSFFAATNYINSVINDPNSTVSQKARLVLGVKGKGIKIGGKTYTQFANIHKFGDYEIKDPLTEEQINNLKKDVLQNIKNAKNTNDVVQSEAFNKAADDAIVQILTQCNNDEDAAITLSALLSQATDNAKELSLGKINGGTNMLGMYVYGTSIGMHFTDIANILMSKPVRIIASMMNSNIFEGVGSKNIQDMFDYFELGPNQEVNSYVAKDLNEEQHDTNDVKFQPRRDALKLIMNELAIKYNHGNRFSHDTTEAEIVGNLQVPLYQLLNDFNEIRVKYNNNPYVHQLVELFERFKLNQNTVINTDPDLYQSFKNLSEGAEEFKVLGQLLHVNQGLETKLDKQLNYLAKFNLVASRQEIINRELSRRAKNHQIKRGEYNYQANQNPEELTIDDFIQNPEHCIEAYEKVKHTINLFDLLYNSKQYYQYVKCAWILDAKQTEISSKYRALKYWTPIIQTELSIHTAKGQSNIVRGLNRMVNDYIISDWLTSPRFGVTKDQPFSIYLTEKERQLIAPEGEKIKGPGYIKLVGSAEGKAQFKKWFEKVLIPNLKQGYNGRRLQGKLQVNYALKNNKFIQALIPNIFTNTVNHNNMIAYTLPINMSPRSDEELNTFQEYKIAFNQLNSDNFGFYQTSKGQIYSLQDLFFIYNAITNYNQPGEKALTSIFSDSIDYGLIHDFYQFEAEFDQTSDITTDTVDKNYVHQFVIPVGSIWGTTSNLVWMSTGDQFGLSLWAKQQDSEDNEYGVETIKRNYKGDIYTPINTTSQKEDADNIGIPYKDKDYHTSINIDGNKYKVTITHYNGHISSIEYVKEGDIKPNKIDFEYMENKLNLQLKIQKVPGNITKTLVPTLSLSNIETLIKNDLNKC